MEALLAIDAAEAAFDKKLAASFLKAFAEVEGIGYLWRLDSFWRLEEKDGGVYVQLESIGLSRSVPAIFAWLVNPLLRSIPRRTLTDLLGATRVFVAKPDPTRP